MLFRMGSASLLVLGLSLEATWLADVERDRVVSGIVAMMNGKEHGSREVRCGRGMQREGCIIEEEKEWEGVELFVEYCSWLQR